MNFEDLSLSILSKKDSPPLYTQPNLLTLVIFNKVDFLNSMKPSVGLLFILGTELKSEFEVLLNLLSLLPSKIIAGSQIDN